LNAVPPLPLAADPRLILRPEELDAALEQFLLAEAALWTTADPALEDQPHKLGRGHFRAAFLLKRRPGIGVKDLARLTGLSKQGASRVLRDLIAAGYAITTASDEDARRRPTALTEAGSAFEAAVSEGMRGHLSAAFRDGGLDAVLGARRILAAVAGPRATRRGGASS
jgi:DNA-binding MarR family transcriptional regulator